MEAAKTTRGAGGRRGGDGKKSVLKSIKAGLQFPVGRIAKPRERAQGLRSTSLWSLNILLLRQGAHRKR